MSQSVGSSSGGRWSLSRRLTLAAGMAAAVALASTSVVVFIVARTQMIADYDRTWQARGESVASALEFHKDGWDLDERPETMAPFAAGSNVAAYQIWAGDQPIAKSPSLAGHELSRNGLPPHRDAQWTTMPDGRQVRIQSWAFTPDHDAQTLLAPEAFIVVSASADDLRHAIKNLAGVLVWTTLLGAGVSACLMALVTIRAMRPLVELSGQLAVRAPGAKEPVTLADPPRELVPVVIRLNEAFDRLEAALAREKWFTADAAHELRTPLAALRLLLEVSQSEADPPDARRRDVDDAHALALRLQRIVDALLALARLDRGLITPRPEHINLTALFDEVWSDVTPAASLRGITVQCNVFTGLFVVSDRDLLRQILANLCDNAVSHGDADAEVQITAATPSPGRVSLTIANEASTAPADFSAAGRRLWRADPARAEVGRHVGIGLPLCQRMASVLNGQLLVERQGSRVVAVLELTDLPDALPPQLAADAAHPGLISR